MRTRLLVWIAGLVVLAGLIAAVGVTVSEGDGLAIALTLGFTIIAALAAAFGSWITWRGNQMSARQQQQMGEDIRRLTELTEGSIEEARAQRPAPVVRFAVTNHGADAASLRRTRLDRELDVEAILDLERRRAMATLPQPPKPRRKADTGQLGPVIAGLDSALEQAAQLQRLAASMGALGYGRDAPATAEEKREFKEKVEAYLERVRSWLDEYKRWEQERHEVIAMQLRFENHGRVPCVGGVYQAHFPDPFDRGPDEYPELGVSPARPKFVRPSPFALANLDVPLLRATVPRIRPIDTFSNVSNTRFRKGSVIVEVGVKKLLHGVPEDSDVFLLHAPDDGSYRIAWEIHAENLPEAASGQLELQLMTEVVHGEPIKDLEELFALVRPDETDDEDSPL